MQDRWFWFEIEIHVNYTDTCWLWTGALSNGYAALYYKSRSHIIHRVVYEYHHGPIPPNSVIDHTCETKRCVNPDHLQVVSSGTNISLYHERKHQRERAHRND
jgi:hypothetical protein